MTTVAVVPFRGAATGKSRLAGRLSQEQRVRLNTYLLRCVIQALTGSAGISRIAIVTPASDDLGKSHTSSPLVVIQDSALGINHAVQMGQNWAESVGADSLLVLPADLPLITIADVQCILNAKDSNIFGVVADSKDGGTGALLLAPVSVIEPAFGVDSAMVHSKRLSSARVPHRMVHLDGLAFDIDAPADLLLLGSEVLSEIVGTSCGLGPDRASELATG